MRAIAALAVLVYHFSIQFMATGGSESHWFYYVFNQIGYAGVDFFFVISGYIMWITTQTINSQHPVLEFAYKRATRIYFGYWPYFFIGLALVTLNPGLLSPQVNLLGSLFLTELETTSLLIQVAWTLQYELYFYALFALLLVFPRKQAMKAIVALTAIIMAWQLYLYLQPNTAGQASDSRLLHFLLSPFCLEFFAGCALGRFFQSQRLKHLKVVLLVGLSLLALAIYVQQAILEASLIGSNHINLRIAVFGTAAVLLLAVLIETEMRGRVLLKRFSTILGGASYSIYLSHTIVITMVFAWGLQNWILLNSQSPGFWIGLLMLFTVLYSIIHYLWIEQPLMRMAKNIQKRLFKS